MPSAPEAFPKNEYALGGGLGAGSPSPAASAAPPSSKAKDSAPSQLLPSPHTASERRIASPTECRAALPHYERIVAANPTTKEAGDALIEMARCQTVLGRLDLARALLERATGIAAVATRARALLEENRSAQPATSRGAAAAEPSAADGQ